MRLPSLIWCVAVLVACAKSEKNETSDDPKKQQVAASTQAAAIDAPPTVAVDAAAAPTTLRGVPWELATAKAVAALPAAPIAYVFLPPDGTMLVGASADLAKATAVTDNASLQKLVPPDPNAPTPPPDDGWGTIGTGTYGPLHGGGRVGTRQGYGIGIGGAYITQSFHAERTDPAKARVVLVASRDIGVDHVGRVVIVLREPIAVAVRGADGAIAALPMPLRGPGGGGLTGAVSISTGSMFHALVTSLDQVPAGTSPVPINVVGGAIRGQPANRSQVRIGMATTVGDLDKNIIRRYLKRTIPKITYCYEKELQKQPDLEGTVVAELVIDPEGKVATSSAKGLNATVASCIAGVIKHIEFPKPKGGIVKVTYPLTFRPPSG